MESSKKPTEPDVLGKVAVRPVEDHEKARWNAIIEREHYLIRLRYQKKKIAGEYLNYCLNTSDAKEFCQRVKTDGINQSNINAKILRTFLVPLPPLAEQQAIVAEIEAAQKLVNANRELITRMETKIQSVLARIWGE